MTDFSLKGRVALVTGSTLGLGLAIACRLAQSGAIIAMHGLGDDSTISAARDQISHYTTDPVQYFRGDLSDAAQVDMLISCVESALGPIDILINNAGMQYVAPIEEFPVDQWMKLIAVNLTAAFLTTRLVVNGMRQRGWGRIVNVSSVSGLIGVANKSAYAASKHGLIGLTKVVAMETATSGVTCNAVCPGWVLTPLVETQIRARAEKNGCDFETEKKALVSEKQPSQEFVTPEQVAGVVAFLCSPDADQVRGATWNIDGGYVAA